MRKSILLVLIFITINLYADDVQNSELTEFVDGTPAVASEVNDNYQVLKDAINDNDSRLDAIESTGADITGVTAGTGLSGGGSSGTVTLSIANDSLTSTQLGVGSVGSSELASSSVYSTEIADGTIVDADISSSAGISMNKINTFAAQSATTATYTVTDFNEETIHSLSLNIPAAGYIMAFGSCTAEWTNSSTSNDDAIVGASLSTTTSIGSNNSVFNVLQHVEGTRSPLCTFNCQSMFYFSSGGTKTIYLLARGGGTGDSANYARGNIMLLYIPNK